MCDGLCVNSNVSRQVLANVPESMLGHMRPDMLPFERNAPPVDSSNYSDDIQPNLTKVQNLEHFQHS